MLGSRKLARLFDHAQQAGAKVVLVGDDRQLAAIEAGGGFRGLRLRLGASELTDNRRQQETWEREAVEYLRTGDLDAALGAYRAHGRLVAAETPGQLKQTLLSDWWQAFQHGERVAILAYRREEVDQFNTACQQLRQHAGQLGPDRLQVGDRQFAVGDAVVCGKNALRTLGVANGSRGQVLALDPERRSMTVRLDNGQEATLDGRYLDHRPAWWTRGNPGRRTIDLGYASTGHRSQGVTLDRALVRVAGAEDREWFYVAATRAAKATTFFDVISPEPRPLELELDVPSPEPRSIDHQLAAIARRDGGKRLAVDTATPLALRQMSKRELRAERDRVAALLRDAPPDRTRLLAHTTEQRQRAEQGLTDATAREEAARDRVAGLGQGAGRLLRRRELAEARDHHTLATPRPSSPVSRPTGPPTGSGRPAAPSRSTWPGTSGTPTCSAPTGRAPAARLARPGRPAGNRAGAARVAARARRATRHRQGPARLAAGCQPGRAVPGALRDHRPRPGARPRASPRGLGAAPPPPRRPPGNRGPPRAAAHHA